MLISNEEVSLTQTHEEIKEGFCEDICLSGVLKEERINRVGCAGPQIMG